MRVVRCVLASLLLTSAGCFRLEQTLSLNRDASGQYDVNYSIAERTIGRVHAVLKARQEMTKPGDEAGEPVEQDYYARLFLDPDEKQLAQELKKHEQYGVTVERLSVRSAGEQRHVTMILRFRDIAELQKAKLFQEYGFSLGRIRGGHYQFYRPGHELADGMPVDITRPAILKFLSPILGGFRVRTEVRMPGRILRTNAHAKSPYAARWQFDSASDPRAPVRAMGEDMVIVFDGRGLDLPFVEGSL
jgi:hypothetical protein